MKRILVIDDDEMIRILFERFLKGKGYAVGIDTLEWRELEKRLLARWGGWSWKGLNIFDSLPVPGGLDRVSMYEA